MPEAAYDQLDHDLGLEPWGLPELDLQLTSTIITEKPRRFEHEDGSPKLWPQCWQGQCPLGVCKVGPLLPGQEAVRGI